MAGSRQLRFRGAVVVLSDATAPMAFCAVGAGPALLDYLAPSLVVVRDVLRELERNLRARPGLARVIDWLEQAEADRVHDLTSESALLVRDFLGNLQTAIDHPDEHIGEVATVFAADELAAAGRRPLVCMDDHQGKAMCRGRGLEHADTPALLVEMVCAGALPFAVGQRVWQQLFSDRRIWGDFRRRIQDEHASALQS